MTIDSSELESLIALDAAGALSDEERAQLEAALGEADAATREAAAAAYDAAAGLADAVPRIDPPPHVRTTLMARVRRQFTFIGAEEGWTPHVLPGVEVKLLALDEERDSVTLLMRVPGGTVYPAHHHTGAEECYVVAGDVRVGGRTLGPGDFHHADGGTDHGTLSSEQGATVLLIVSRRDYFPADSQH